MLKAVATSAIGLSLLASTASEALWVQNLPETEIITQFHGDPESAQLRLFMAGNQFVVMDNLIAEFKKQHPKYQEIYYVTIPPGKELQWILQGGAEWRAADFPNVQELDKVDPDNPSSWVMNTTGAPGVGFKMLNMPDVYTTVARGHMNQLAGAGLVDKAFTYTHNQLAVMAHDTQVADLTVIANDDSSLFPGKAGFNVDGELTAEGLYRLFASNQVWISEPDIQTQGIERHIWRMYTNVSQAVFDCAGNPPTPPNVCSVVVNDVFPPAPDTCTNNASFFASESDDSLRKIVYQLKRCDEGPYTDPDDATTFVTAVHHLETPANIEEGFNMVPQRLTVGPVWGTEVEFQQFRKDNLDIVAIRISDDPGPDGKALNRSDDVNYLAAMIDTANEKNNLAARDFLKFLKSPEAQVILERAGFIPATPTELNTTIPLP
ncbi:MAG: substrate-binding domain-containing protein, partial [Gammaproteobacteria bacterium]